MSNSIFQKHTIKEVVFETTLRDVVGYDNYGDVDTIVVRIHAFDSDTGRRHTKTLRFPASALD